MGKDELAELRAENEALRARVAELESLPDGQAAAFLQSVLAAVPAFILRADSDERIRYINRLQPGLRMEDVLGRDVYAYLDARSRPIARACVERARQTGEAQRYEAVGDGPHGEPTHYESFVAPVPERDGRFGICLVAFDLSVHKQREAALRESEQKLRLALDATGIGLWSWDARTGEVRWDARMRELCGVAETYDLQRYTSELVHEDDRALVEEARRETMARGRYVGCPHRVVRPDGSIRWMITAATLLRDEGGKPLRLVGGNLDITEQRLLEEQLRHAQKMESLGNLTAGIAHNLNNVLMVLLPTLELLAQVVPSEHFQAARDALQSAQRGADYIRQLMAYAGRGTSPRGVHDVVEIVERAMRMCRRSFERHIVLDVHAEDGTPAIWCDAAGIEQVILNVLLNARDALDALDGLDGGGDPPTIRVSVESALDAKPPPHLARTGPCVRIVIRDNGRGMTREVRRKIFEPFFTTKGIGRSSGLGLATSYAIVREHDGWIECDSRPGRGTSMTVYLPVGTAGACVAAQPVARVSARPSTILLVDDEVAIRRVVAHLLEDDGHKVIAVPGIGEALGAAERHPEVDLVLLDRSMPGAPGNSVLHSLRKRLPRARIFYFTGHDVPDAERARVEGIISKPLSGDALSVAVRQALRVERLAGEPLEEKQHR